MKKFVSLVFISTLFFVCGFFEDKSVSYAYDIYNLFSHEHLLFYEEEVAKEQVVSDIDIDVLTKSADNIGISVDKLQKLLIFQHALKSADIEMSIEELSKLSNKETISYFKKYINFLKTTKSPEELKELENKFKDIKKA